MPAKTGIVTEQLLRKTTLPTHGGKYAVVTHGWIIDHTRDELAKAGFEISTELYKSSIDGQIAQGTYALKYSKDPDMGLMFAWSNSYNKMMRFKCAVGGQVFICMNGVVRGDMGNYGRKHLGNATVPEVIEHIHSQISNATKHFDSLIQDKEILKQIHLDLKSKGSILGQLFLDSEVLTLTQVGIVEKEIRKPSYQYSQDPDSAWDLYNHITTALKDSHPMHYLDDHRKVHNFFMSNYNLLNVNPPALDLNPPVRETNVTPVINISNGVRFA